MNKVLMSVIAVSGLVAASAASAKPWVAEAAQVPLANGMAAIALVKNGNAERTVVCRNTVDDLVKMRPEGIAFDTTYRHGKKATVEDVVDEANIIPVGIDSCTVSQGNHFTAAVAKARTTA